MRPATRWAPAVLVSLAALAQLIYSDGADWNLVLPLTIVGVAALAVRQEQPFWSGLTAVTAVVVTTLAPVVGYPFLGATIGLLGMTLVYAVARHERFPASAWWIGTVFVLSVLRDIAGLEPAPISDGILIVMVAGVGFLLRSRAIRAAAAVASVLKEEREQIARDLHDVLAHGLSSIAVFADGAAYGADPESPEGKALIRIRDTARATLSETRGVIGVLRETLGEQAAPPGLGQLSELAGDGPPPVTVQISGDPQRVPSHVARALYRICQEAITNARRHAVDVTAVDVRLTVTKTDAHLTITNDGKARANASPGFGLRGIAERAGLLGGWSSAGAGPGGGWVVAVEIPIKGKGGK